MRMDRLPTNRHAVRDDAEVTRSGGSAVKSRLRGVRDPVGASARSSRSQVAGDAVRALNPCLLPQTRRMASRGVV